MWLIHSPSHSATFNLAAEEHLLRVGEEEVLLVYRNQPCAVVGKHQHTLSEVDTAYAQRHGIGVARRISGGGAVYHDLGNVNFCFIANGQPGRQVNFQRFTQPIAGYLRRLGLDAQPDGRHSLLVNGLKVSGNAEHVFRDRILHHGTLLFETHLGHLEGALRGSSRYRHAGVPSVRSPVDNIGPWLRQPLPIERFIDGLMAHIAAGVANPTPYILSPPHLQAIQRLEASRYSTWEWVYGYSPAYAFRAEVPTAQGFAGLQVRVEQGAIAHIEVVDGPLAVDWGLLVGCRHHRHSLEERLAGLGIAAQAAKAIAQALC